VDLAQLIKFLVVELIHPGLNPKFDMGVTFMVNYFLRPRQQRGALDDQLYESQDQIGSVFQMCS
jgi:hypothetical protein